LCRGRRKFSEAVRRPVAGRMGKKKNAERGKRAEIFKLKIWKKN